MKLCTKIRIFTIFRASCFIFAAFVIYLTPQMIILKDSEALHHLMSKLHQQSTTIGFVPTMGALHQGHASLVKASQQENDFTLVSVFVNPTQFDKLEDLTRYPRLEEQDIDLLKKIGADAVFFPKVEDIYPDGEIAQHFEFNGIDNQMEGKFRPGHFDGVGTVVKRFFEMIQPNKAYFGEKDFQQLAIIKYLVRTHEIPVEIVPVSIKREADGLAMSSRNLRLSPEMRQEATKIYRILLNAKEFLKNHSIEATHQFVVEAFSQTKLVLEYFEIADEETLISVQKQEQGQKIRAFIAVFAGEIRLIDNLELNDVDALSSKNSLSLPAL